MNLKHFFTSQYLFDVNATYITPKEKLFFIAGVVLVLLAVVMKIASILSSNPIEKKYRQKFYSLFLWIGLMEMFWYFCRYENVKFFNTKFVSWLIILTGVIWLVSILVSIFKHYKTEKDTWDKEQLKLKYLPK